MTLSELLNSDVTEVGQWIGAGLKWWRDELVGMLPAPARRWLETRPSLTAEPRAEGGYRLTRNGRTVMQGVGGKVRPVTLRLPREAALIREAPAPAMAERDLRRMFELDIDRLTPFRPDQVFVDVVLSEDAAGDGGPRHAVVAAIQRERAVQAIEQASAAGLETRALGVAGASASELALDFLPGMRAAQAVARPGPNRMLIWAAVAVLALANLGVAVGRDMLEVRALGQKVEAQQPQVERVSAVRNAVLAEDRRRADVVVRRESGEPLRMLDVVTGAVPSGAWVDRLAWDGRTVRLSGYRQDQVDVAAALRTSRQLTNIRNSGTDLLSRQTAGQPFDLTADLKRPSGG